VNPLDLQYQQLLKDIIEYGVEKQDRTGTGTKSIFGYTIRHNMADGFPLLTTKKVAFKTMVTELLWFLKGDTNIKYLVDNDCHIWDGDAYKNYATNKYGEWIKKSEEPGMLLTQEEFINKIKTDDEFAEEWGELGPIYGKQWRDWNELDQIHNLIKELKSNPDSRRLMVSAWNVGEINHMVLPPCHYGFQVYTTEMNEEERKNCWATYIGKSKKYVEKMDHNRLDKVNAPSRKISLMWNQRSVDTFLGLPFNISSYGLLLIMIAKEVNMIPDQLIGSLGDTHLYLNHIKQAKEQIKRTPFKLPTVEINEVDVLKGEVELELKNYLHHDPIKAPLSN
jgi:thymidylate synthase